jgi:hypothetical protein
MATGIARPPAGGSRRLLEPPAFFVTNPPRNPKI